MKKCWQVIYVTKIIVDYIAVKSMADYITKNIIAYYIELAEPIPLYLISQPMVSSLKNSLDHWDAAVDSIK